MSDSEKLNNNMKSKLGLIPVKCTGNQYYFMGIRRKTPENPDKKELDFQLGGCSSKSE